MNSFAFIPARGGSKGIKGKNLKLLHGYPLIAWSIAYALGSELIERVIVSTDSPEIRDAALYYGAEVPELRPSEYATDNCSDMQLFEYIKSKLTSWDLDKFHLIVHLRPTSPFRKYSHLLTGLEAVYHDQSISSVRSVQPTDICPWKMFTKNNSGFLQPINPSFDVSSNEFYNLPRQDFPVAYQPNGVLDILRVNCKNGLHGTNIYPIITETCPDIDTLRDWEMAQSILDSKGIDKFVDLSVLKYLEMKSSFG